MSDLLGLAEQDKNTGTGEIGPDVNDLEMRVKNGASWFYWIAGLSLVNSIMFFYGATVAFLAGLGFTQLADAIVQAAIENGMPESLTVVSLVFNFVMVAIFAFFGYYANKQISSVFMIGIILYVLDGLLLLLMGMFLSTAFHAFALIFIVRGYLACRTLNQYEKARASFTPPPPPQTI